MALVKITDASGRQWQHALTAQAICTIGRAPDNLVVLDDPRASRYHAHIKAAENGQVTIIDGAMISGELRRSANKVFINGEPRYEHVLKNGDRVTIGASTLRFEQTPEERTGDLHYDDKPLGHTQLRISANEVMSTVLRSSKPELGSPQDKMLETLQRHTVRQERLAAVGLLLSGVAHELNNPLQAILGTLELLEQDRGISAAVLEEVAFVKTQSGRAREIIRNLSRFSSQQSGPPALVDLREVIEEVAQLRRRDLDTSGIALTVEVNTDRKVYANFTEVEQVTLNFVINAQQSIEVADRARGRILIRVFDAGKRVRLEVQDDGPGVKPEDEPKLFQPFFTTKPVGKGTGLGLSVSYGIVESYGGTIGHRGNEWGGATFYFELPVTDPSARTLLGSAQKGTSKPDDRPPVLPRPVSPGV
jgi:signal transduction histidine kinase